MSKTLHTSVRWLVAGALLGANLALTPAPAHPAPAAHPAVRAAAPAAHTPQRHVVLNPHLHLRPAPAAKAVKAEPGKPARVVHTTTVVTRNHWVSHWHYAEWATLHRGTGTIVGRVVNKNGAAVPGASVVLRKPNGAMFRRVSAKHVVNADGEGRFVMRKVRLGSYRVRAHQGKPTGHTNLVLRGGQVASVQIQI